MLGVRGVCSGVPASSLGRAAQLLAFPCVRVAVPQRRLFPFYRSMATHPGKFELDPDAIVLPDGVSAKQLAKLLGMKPADVIDAIEEMGADVDSPNAALDEEVVELVAFEFDKVPVWQRDVPVYDEGDAAGGKKKGGKKMKKKKKQTTNQAAAAQLPLRDPVITVMGHVDHGKTTLLDSLRNANVVATEAGGITQRIGAFSVKVEHAASGQEQRMTFIDTPGHFAFAEMRQRGANTTDVVVLVVAGDDGVMPQTQEAIRYAQAAGAPIIVAVNKMDKPGANPERVYNELLRCNLVVEAMGGDVQTVEAEMMELRADPDAQMEGTVIEARLDKSLGPCATVLVQAGTLRRGDCVVAGDSFGKVRDLKNEAGEGVDEAGVSQPVELTGLKSVPEPGEIMVGTATEQEARKLSEVASAQRELRDHIQRQKQLMQGGAAGLTEFTNAERFIPIIVKADLQGTLEAVVANLNKSLSRELKPLRDQPTRADCGLAPLREGEEEDDDLEDDDFAEFDGEDDTSRKGRKAKAAADRANLKDIIYEEDLRLSIIHEGVGPITESDIDAAVAKKPHAIVLGFNVKCPSAVKQYATENSYNLDSMLLEKVIYHMLDRTCERSAEMLPPMRQRAVHGVAEVKQVFDVGKSKKGRTGVVAGSYVNIGSFDMEKTIQVVRGGKVVHVAKPLTIRRFKDVVEKVGVGNDCGIQLIGCDDIREGDRLVAYDITPQWPTLEFMDADP